MRFGLLASGQFPEGLPPPAQLREVARAVDALPYDSIWAGDHIAFRHPILEPTVALAALAAWTSRVTIGAAVLLLPLRHPALVAKQVASLDYLDGGRTILGVGVGGESRGDFAAVGVDPRGRGRRTDEAIQALRALWHRAPASYHGSVFDFTDVTMEPRPAPDAAPPIWIGGRSDAALRRVAELGDGWLGYLVSPEGCRRSWDAVEQRCHAIGRDPCALARAVMLPTCVAETGERAADRLSDYLTRRYGTAFSRHAVDRYCLAGSAAACRDRVAAYAAAGVEHIVLMPIETTAAEAERLAGALVEPMLGELPAGAPVGAVTT